MDFRKAPNETTDGTWLQGHVDVTYSRLIEVFGPPHSAGDGYKTQAEWCLRFDDGTIATVYDYRNRLTPERTRNWGIGGFEKRALERVLEVLA